MIRVRWKWLALALLTLAAIVVLPQWKAAIDEGGQKPAAPFRIAGNLYYVGANDVTAYLFTGPAGHVLIDGGFPGTAPLILRNIARLGFRARVVRILLNSHAHADHAGGLAALKRATGARLWVSAADADEVETGGDDPMIGIARPLIWIGLLRFPPARVDRRLRDGDHVRVGPIDLVARLTPGHTRGCTSWSTKVRAQGRDLDVVALCSLTLPANLGVFGDEPYRGFRQDYEGSLRTLRRLPVDIWLTPHARTFGRWRKFQASRRAGGAVDPFVDRAGYADYLDRAARRYRAAYR